MTVDLYIDQLSDAHLRTILEQLRAIILETLPNVEESIKWNIPFYTYHGMLCYLNPQKDHIALGFAKGAQLSNAQGILSGTGSQVRHIRIGDIHDIPTEGIIEVLMEAAMLNELRG